MRTKLHPKRPLGMAVGTGGAYNPTENRYDPNGRGFHETMKSLAGLKSEIKVSSAGLIYHHFGKEVIQRLTGLSSPCWELKKIYDQLYQNLIEEVDRHNNDIGGTRMPSALTEHFDNIDDVKIARDSTTSLCSRVEYMNVRWYDENKSNLNVPEQINKRFHAAMQLCGDEFLRQLTYLKDVWLPGYVAVKEAVQKRHVVRPSVAVIRFLHPSCLLEEHLFNVEAELGIPGEIKLVLLQVRIQPF